MKHLLSALRIYIFMTFLFGLLYPMTITLLGQAFFEEKVKGSLIEKNGNPIGSRWIAQKFQSESYFWPRPSATDYNPLPSGGTNLGPTSQALMEARQSRLDQLGLEAPVHLLFASASGLDPQISPEAALYQVSRIAKARGLSEDDLREVIYAHLEKRQWGFLGEERVNVLELNLALDERK